MSATRVDWFAEVQQYAAKSTKVRRAVAEAKEQASRLQGTQEFWEAVYTLARQAVDMRGAGEVQQ